MVVVGHSLQVRFVSGEAIRAAQDETDKGENEAKGNDKGDAQLAEAWGFRLVAKSKQVREGIDSFERACRSTHGFGCGCPTMAVRYSCRAGLLRGIALSQSCQQLLS